MEKKSMTGDSKNVLAYHRNHTGTGEVLLPHTGDRIGTSLVLLLNVSSTVCPHSHQHNYLIFKSLKRYGGYKNDERK